MPTKKKTPRNGFYFYMLDVRDDIVAKEGRRPSMADLQTIASPGWNNMSAGDKEIYNNMAKEDKQKGKSVVESKFNSVGVSFAILDAQAREKEEAQESMKATIKAMVKTPTKEAVLETYFYVSHVNYYYKIYKNQEDRYCPCEISIIEFSFEDGITNKYHQILHQGTPPLGVSADAKELAEKYHDIYLYEKADKPNCNKEENMQLVFSNIVDFLRTGATRDARGREVLPPIFTMPNSMNHNHSMTAVENALEKFTEASHERQDLFRVYPLSQLFYQLKLKFDDDFKPEHGAAILETELEKDLFSTAANIECDYHMESENNIWCSQSIALRWVYPLLDHICPKAGIEMIPGKHRPSGLVAPVQAKPWNPECDDGGWNVVKTKDSSARKKQECREDMKVARSIPSLNLRAWDPAATSQDKDNIPAMGGFPSLPQTAKPQPGGPSTVSGPGQSVGHSSMTTLKGFGRGRLFEISKK